MKNLNKFLKTSKFLPNIKYNKQNIDYRYDYINDNNRIAEVALWKAVILQALIDLQSRSKKKLATTFRIKALTWINRRNIDFLTVCSYAELDPEYVLEKAKNIKDKNPFLI